jgi:hypothetical protein
VRRPLAEYNRSCKKVSVILIHSQNTLQQMLTCVFYYNRLCFEL